MSQILSRDSAFLHRFQLVSSRKTQIQLWQIVVKTALFACIGTAGLMAADYALELNRGVRAGALTSLAAAVVLFAVWLWWRAVPMWRQSVTAAEIEQAFPELGQSVRTTVQFGALPAEQVEQSGVAPSLIRALADQTHQRALPLTIEDVIPLGALRWFTGLFVAGMLVLAAAICLQWEWQCAAERIFLSERPYRLLEVQPGDRTVAEGDDLNIDVSLIGRTNRDVVLFVRPVEEEDQPWNERELQIATSVEPTSPTAERMPRKDLTTQLGRLTKPLEYRVAAGELLSPVYTVDIRRPLRISHSTVELTPPAYTGQPNATFLDLNLSGLQGTTASFDIHFDKEVKSAAVVLAPPRPKTPDEESQGPEVLPLTLVNQDAERAAGISTRRTPSTTTHGLLTLTLDADRQYTLVAEAVDGTQLKPTKYRIRVREDQPPAVVIEEPRDTVEVHGLAEVLMQIRVSDDYGLSQAGIIFQINNEQEIPLIAQDFAAAIQADQELSDTGRVSPKTRATLEKVLPLELFELTQKDSVAYYAFAEDNRPDRPQRTETDLQFIDIRPFKRTYQLVDPDPMVGMGGSGFKSLEELIRRQRFALNRTQQIEKRALLGREPDAMALNQLMEYETELAQSARESAQGLEARGFDDTELFYLAEAVMLQAVDSLSVGKWENASLQMRDALKSLIEQRDRFQLFVMKNPDAAQLEAMRRFDRMQAQKLRRPKTDKEEARELIRRLQDLANQEKDVAEALKSRETPDAEAATETP